MSDRITISQQNFPDNGVIRADGPVFLYGLKGLHIKLIEITLPPRTTEKHVNALMDDDCEGLVVNRVIIHGKPDQSSKDSWMATDQMGIQVNSDAVILHKVYAEYVHVPLKILGAFSCCNNLLTFNTSGDAFQLCGDRSSLNSGLITGLLEVYPYHVEHQDVGMLFPVRGADVLADVIVQHVELKRSGHAWENLSPQGILAPDNATIRCEVRDCILYGVHPEHGVRFGYAVDCKVERVTTSGAIAFGDRKSIRKGSNNLALECQAPTIAFEDESAGFEQTADENDFIAVRQQGETTMMKMSQLGVQVLMKSEGFCNDVYLDSASLPTIGVGHCLTQSEVSAGKIHLDGGEVLDLRHGPISNEQVMALLEHDLSPREAAVNRLFTVPLSQSQFDALLHWLFNVGEAAAAKSTLRKVLNKGDFDAVPDELRKWNKATVAGKKTFIQGLANRREVEVSLWNGDYLAERGRIEVPEAIDSGMSPMPEYEAPKHDVPVEDLFKLDEFLKRSEQRFEQMESGIKTSVADSVDQMLQRQQAQANAGYDHANPHHKAIYKEAYEYAKDDVIDEHSKPTWHSKILGFAVATGMSFLGAKYGLNLPPETSNFIENAIVGGGLGAIGIARVWFTSKVLRS